jgi:hypothetical protein
MYSQIDKDRLTKAGRFLLDDITLVSYHQQKVLMETLNNIYQNQVIEINIYESLEGPGLSGNDCCADAQSVISAFTINRL